MIRSLFIFAILFLAPFSASAASLYLSPGTGTYKVGDTLTVTVYAESTGQAMNAVSGTVSVPTDSFDIVGVSNSGSMVNFWVQEPVRQGASASFEGVVLNPGYTGSAGKIATITLRAKRVGTGSLSFSSASILANDGKGTNLLSGTRGASYTVGEGAVPAPAPTTPVPAPTEDTEAGPDTEGPEIKTFSVQNREARTNPLIAVNIQATDVSGVALYELSLDGGAYISWDDFASGVYKLTVGPGAHTLSLRVVDTYGNETRDYIVFTVEPLSTPRIISYPERFTLGDIDARVIGDAPAGITRVTLTLAPQLIAKNTGFFGSSVSALPRTIEGEVHSDGTWSAPLSSIDLAGEYLVSVTGYDARGAGSFPSVPVHISAQTPLLTSIIFFIFSWPVLLVIIAVLLGLLWWKRHSIAGSAGTHIAKVRSTLKSAFATMHRNISKERKLLEHRDGADKKEEEEMLDALEENVETTEERIEAEVEKLEETVQEEQKG